MTQIIVRFVLKFQVLNLSLFLKNSNYEVQSLQRRENLLLSDKGTLAKHLEVRNIAEREK